MSRLKIQPGARYGKLTVVQDAKSTILPSGQVNRMMECICDCGRVKVIRLLHMVRGRISSCGCISGEQHGESKSKLYNTWRGMKNRCYTPSYREWHHYGGKGIVMCDEWRDSYLCFREWAINNGWVHGLHIDRIDSAGNYAPDNCRCVTPLVNSNNICTNIKVDYNGESISFGLIIHEKGLSSHRSAIYHRIKRGWDVQKAIDMPIRKGNYRRKI